MPRLFYILYLIGLFPFPCPAVAHIWGLELRVRRVTGVGERSREAQEVKEERGAAKPLSLGSSP